MAAKGVPTCFDKRLAQSQIPCALRNDKKPSIAQEGGARRAIGCYHPEGVRTQMDRR
jgi:hypothetical protein